MQLAEGLVRTVAYFRQRPVAQEPGGDPDRGRVADVAEAAGLTGGRAVGGPAVDQSSPSEAQDRVGHDHPLSICLTMR